MCIICYNSPYHTTRKVIPNSSGHPFFGYYHRCITSHFPLFKRHIWYILGKEVTNWRFVSDERLKVTRIQISFLRRTHVKVLIRKIHNSLNSGKICDCSSWPELSCRCRRLILNCLTFLCFITNAFSETTVDRFISLVSFWTCKSDLIQYNVTLEI